MSLGRGPSGLRTFGFAAVYAASALVGRMTVVDERAALGLFWPAAGVGALWFLVLGRVRALDLTLFALITFLVNHLTGAPLPMALVLLVANVLQLLALLWLLHRWCPDLWGVGGTGRIDSSHSLGAFLAAATGASLLGAGVGTVGMFLVTDWYEPLQSMVWMGRNLCGLLAVGCFGHLVAHWMTFGPGPALPRLPRRTRVLEGTALLAATAAIYLGAFFSELPLAFPLLAVTVWGGLRFSTLLATAHAFLCGGFAVALTVLGVGPFAGLEPIKSALFVQLFIIMVVVTALALATSRDERARMAQDLVESERAAASQANLFEAVLDSMHDGVLVMDQDHGVVFENPAAIAQLRGTAAIRGAEAVTMPAARPDGSPIEPPERPTSMALGGHTVRDFDLLLEPEGGRRVMSISARPLAKGREDEGDRAVVVFRDVTDDRAQRADLVAFSGVVAHDLRNPLQVVDGWLEHLEVDLARGRENGGVVDLGQAQLMVSRARAASARMRTLIGDLLNLALSGESELRASEVDLRATLAEAAQGRDVTLDLGDLPPVRADPVLVRQLVDNLLGNAVKYVGAGVTPHVEVTGGVVHSGQGDWVRVRVADNGIGIPSGQHERIFRQFHRAHAASYPGTGLGLAICRRIVERHGGVIRAYDNPAGQGTVFEFTLPPGDLG